MSSRPTQRFIKGQTIVQEGSVGDRSFKIVSGEVVVCKKNADGNLIPIAKLGQDELFGEMYLFEDDHTRSATVIAISSEVELEIYFQNELIELFGQLAPSTRQIFAGMAHRLKKTSSQYANTVQAHQTETVAVQLPDGSIRESSSFVKRGQSQN